MLVVYSINNGSNSSATVSSLALALSVISGSVEQLSTLGDGELGNWGSGTVRS
jgi:hypothetical protein